MPQTIDLPYMTISQYLFSIKFHIRLTKLIFNILHKIDCADLHDNDMQIPK